MKSTIKQFVDTIKGNPKDVINWCLEEIKAYEKLIKILENEIKKVKK